MRHCQGPEKNFSTNVWGINFDIRVQDKFNIFSNLVRYFTFSLTKRNENHAHFSVTRKAGSQNKAVKINYFGLDDLSESNTIQKHKKKIRYQLLIIFKTIEILLFLIPTMLSVFPKKYFHLSPHYCSSIQSKV